ncbi:oxidoreductase [Xylaria bambusicola]|uniref:oxidoreductase n=1 Tax=Xylaria bambusicola TaxID=326684 RepID=UPI0020075A13|nr:oxidoreductase [Xylaria bambusicola]KAI0509080.1 oxidoreductase [Xylaria bambusicola]
MADNYAAILIRQMRRPLDVDEVEPRFPDEDEIVIKNAAVSINPIDAAMQDGYVTNMTTPGILGVDVAGEVVEVGSQINRFNVGDRVMGHALRLATDDDRHAGFQNYTVLWSNMACPIPPNLSYEDASTMPLGISTAASALFQDISLGLEPPVSYPPSRDEWVIIAGATGNVGSHGVRLASAAGYKVIATASTSAFDLARKLGATELVDYKDKNLADTLVEKLSGKRVAGAFDASGISSSIIALANAVARSEGKKVVSSVSDDYPSKAIPSVVRVEFIFAIDIRDKPASKRVWEDFLPDALATGQYFTPYPRARIFGDGLGVIQAAMDNEGDREKKAPAGQKAVVTLN